MFVSFTNLNLVFTLHNDENLHGNVNCYYFEMSCPHFWIPLFNSGNDFCGLSVKKKGVKRGYLMSLS
jgi:hypothetical protein